MPTASPSPPSASHSLDVFPLRQFLRTIHKPAWLGDYVYHCDTDSPSCLPSIYKPAHTAYLALLSYVQEPKNYSKASRDIKRVEAMGEELVALEHNGIWTLEPLPPREKAIACRWVFKPKLNPDDSALRHMARLVAKGYNQVEGIDYFGSFSPVAKVVTVRVFLVVAVTMCWFLWQLDVSNAFLHRHLDKEVYMIPPEEYHLVIPGSLCRLRRSLYGLKQASRQWNIELTKDLWAMITVSSLRLPPPVL
ncbi:UNVERIFIED_CONTAM: Retrovirus-related Pol polyprotein from transposon RE2 [Sesamum indicum]